MTLDARIAHHRELYRSDLLIERLVSRQPPTSSSKIEQMICSVEGCGKPRRRREWCGAHYQRLIRHGDVQARIPLTRTEPTLEERFWARVERGEGCWKWRPGLRSNGYALPFYVAKGQGIRPHRFAYEATYGKIPDGLVIDHLCRNTGCVRPDHLEAVTQGENVRRGQRWTIYCPRGHAKIGGNLYLEAGYRRCRICRTAQRAA